MKLKIELEDAWWREYRRDAPNKFKLAMESACQRILKTPTVHKPWGEVKGETIWRIYEPSTRHHIFYRVSQEEALIVIETIHGAKQGSSPDFE